jgi:putative SOS response-associated peptidase YedK
VCARYELTTTPEWMVERFGLKIRAAHEARRARALERGEIRPTNLAPVIVQNGELAFMPWGLSVSWQSQPLINARAETLEQKSTFKRLLGQRCLVPASAYFEWRRDGKAKTKTRIGAANDDLLAIAGLVGDGRFTLVTCAPAPSIAHIHDRMPLILARDVERQWLDGSVPFAALKTALVPYDGALTWSEPAATAQRSLFA